MRTSRLPLTAATPYCTRPANIAAPRRFSSVSSSAPAAGSTCTSAGSQSRFVASTFHAGPAAITVVVPFFPNRYT